MKKIVTALALLSTISLAAMAQKEVLFKIKVNPNRDYDMVMQMDMNMEMNMTSDTAAKTPSPGFPMLMTMQSGMNGDIKTAALNADGKVPYTMTMKSLATKMTMNGKDTPIPVPATNETLFGTYSIDGKMTIDSITGKKADDLVKATLSKTVESLQTNIKFPDKALKVGDTFTMDVPMNIPMAGSDGIMVTKTTYTLTAIQNKLAYFDVKYLISTKLTLQGMAVTMVGGGDGKLVYDIPENYGTAATTNMNVTYNMIMPQGQNMKMNGKMKIGTTYKTIITKK